MTVTYTVEDIMSEGLCEEYTVEKVEELLAGRESISPRQIAELNIPILDRIWILGRLLYRLSQWRAHRITRLIALDVADLWPCPNIAWWYLVSGDKNSRYAAWDASWNAASVFHRSVALAARSAAASVFLSRGAAREAADGNSRAAPSAACDKARDDATWNAARDASWSARDGKDAALERYLGWIIRFGWEV